MPGPAVEAYAPSPAYTFVRSPVIRAVLRTAHLDVLDVVAAVDRDLVVLRAILCPLHRSAELHRGEAHQRLVGIRRDLAAEPAADLGRDDPDPMLGKLEHHRAEEPMDVWVLAGGPERELAGALVVAGDGRARLHRGGEQPLLHDALLDRHFGRLERLLRVAAGHYPGERDVVGHLVVQLRRARLGHLLRDRRRPGAGRSPRRSGRSRRAPRRGSRRRPSRRHRRRSAP